MRIRLALCALFFIVALAPAALAQEAAKAKPVKQEPAKTQTPECSDGTDSKPCAEPGKAKQENAPKDASSMMFMTLEDIYGEDGGRWLVATGAAVRSSRPASRP